MWGPWLDSPPSLVASTHIWNQYTATSGVFRGGFADVTYNPTFTADVIADVQAGTGGAELEPGGSTNLLLIGPTFWELAVSLEGPFPDDHLEYSGNDTRTLVSFAATVPTLLTYPTALDSAVPGDPGTDGLIQYEGGTDTFFWSDFTQNWYSLNSSAAYTSDRMRLRFSSYVDPTTGATWPAYSAADTAADIATDGTISVHMADFPAYDSAASFSLWYENGYEWSATDGDFDVTGFAGGGGAADSGGWQTDGLATWPRPYVQRPRYRVWTGGNPNLSGNRLTDRIHFIPIRRRP